MLQPASGVAQTAPRFNLPSFNQEAVRHILLGDYGAIVSTIHRLERLGYCVGAASPKGFRVAWSEPLPTGRNGEFISVMTRKRTLS